MAKIEMTAIPAACQQNFAKKKVELFLRNKWQGN